MLFQLTWTRRDSGASEEADQRLQAIFQKFTPPKNLTIHSWLDRVDGMGGFALVEGEIAEDVPAAVLVFSPYYEFQFYPVIQHADWVAALGEAATFRQEL
jgi:hypothetical protein